jgi:hypothetical protein
MFSFVKSKARSFFDSKLRYHMIGGDGSRQLIDPLGERRELGIVVD